MRSVPDLNEILCDMLAACYSLRMWNKQLKSVLCISLFRVTNQWTSQELKTPICLEDKCCCNCNSNKQILCHIFQSEMLPLSMNLKYSGISTAGTPQYFNSRTGNCLNIGGMAWSKLSLLFYSSQCHALQFGHYLYCTQPCFFVEIYDVLWMLLLTICCDLVFIT